MSLALLWENRRIIGEVIGLAALLFVGWWFFIHNPAKIAELERRVQNGERAITLLDDIQKGKANSYAQVQLQISSIKAHSIPRNAVLIKHGGVLQAVPAK